MGLAAKIFVVSLLLVAGGRYHQILGDAHNHKYNDGEEVVLWMNKVGPYNNSQEMYPYFSLPFCSGPKLRRYNTTLNEALQGVDFKFSGYEIEFNRDVATTIICMVDLTDSIIKAFTNAVMNEYWYQMFIDGLLIWGKVGEKDDQGNNYIYTHKKFDIGHNNQQIVDMNVTTEKEELIVAGSRIRFSYEVNWKPSVVEFKDRKHVDPNLFQHKIRWFNILNCVMMVTPCRISVPDNNAHLT